jgi:hypothetical protein
VSLGEIELELQRHLEGLPAPQPLARFTIADLWVTFRNTQQASASLAANTLQTVGWKSSCCAAKLREDELIIPACRCAWLPCFPPAQGSMFVGVCVPRVEARDLRPEVPPEQSLVISSGHKASFLMLDVSCLAWPAALFRRCCCWHS